MAFVLEKIRSEIEDRQIDSAPYKIIPYPADFTLQVLHQKWIDKEIIIPGFQRRYVWKLTQASRLIESFLLGLPVPPVFLYRDRASQELLVVDGQQRLKTVVGYFEGQFPDTDTRFSLRGIRPEWDGLTFDQLAGSEQIRLRDAVLRAIIIEQIDPKDNSSISHIVDYLIVAGLISTLGQ